jgi:hypothetical protein
MSTTNRKNDIAYYYPPPPATAASNIDHNSAVLCLIFWSTVWFIIFCAFRIDFYRRERQWNERIMDQNRQKREREREQQREQRQQVQELEEEEQVVARINTTTLQEESSPHLQQRPRRRYRVDED